MIKKSSSIVYNSTVEFVELTLIFVVPVSAKKTLVDCRGKMNTLPPATPYINVALFNPSATELR